MASETIKIRQVAVLGAGVMGAQIAAHFVNAGVATLLFDLAAPQGDANGIVNHAIKNLTTLKPTPLATLATAKLITAANYAQHLAALQHCDLIIEAIAEKFVLKEQLYQKIIPYLSDNVIIASNTSGLSINQLAQVLPAKLQARFCGIHFFNPPRYMHLIELIGSATMETTLLDKLETFLVTYLGKGVVRAQDTPNFIANRIGVFSLLATLYHAAQFKLTFDEVDALTGTLIGRPSSATLRTMDIVGLDTIAHVVQTMASQLVDDPWQRYYTLPSWLTQLIAQGALGQKTGAGIYKKHGQDIYVLDVTTQQYRLAKATVDDRVLAILKMPSRASQLQSLRQLDHPQAKFLWACYRDVLHYSAVHMPEIAATCTDLDDAMRWGFGWQQGPFEIWQQAGIIAISEAISADIAAGNTMSVQPLPSWLTQVTAFYQDNSAWSPRAATFQARHKLAVYQRHLSDVTLNEVVFETAAVKMWHQQDNIAIVSFKSKLNSITEEVLEDMLAAIKLAEQHFAALILWQVDAQNFSIGANLKQFEPLFASDDNALLTSLAQSVAKFQQTAMALKYSTVPTIAAVRGRALGGGCELAMHCDKVVAAFESYIGLVESGVGLLPAGGGCKEFAQRAAACLSQSDPFELLQHYFKTIAMAEVSTSAVDAKIKGYLRASDVIVMNAAEVLYVAKAHANAMIASNYLPPIPTTIAIVGKDGIANLKMQIVNLLAGGYISEYDALIATKIAEVICGGNLNKGQLVDEAWLLRLEREALVTLASHPKTQQRIRSMLETGKPLRN